MQSMDAAAQTATTHGSGPSISVTDMYREDGDLVLETVSTTGEGSDTTRISMVVAWDDGSKAAGESFSTGQNEEINKTLRVPLSEIPADRVQITASINNLGGGDDNQNFLDYDLRQLPSKDGGMGTNTLLLLGGAGLLLAAFLLLR